MTKKIFFALFLVITWMGIIFFYSNMESHQSTMESESIVVKIITKIDQITHANEETIKYHQSQDFISKANHFFRKLCHASIYLALSILVFNVLLLIIKRNLIIYNVLCLLICFLYACTDEYHQTFVPGRSGQFSDILIDMSGVLMGCIMLSLIYKYFERRKKLSTKRIFHEK